MENQEKAINSVRSCVAHALNAKVGNLAI